MASARDDDLSLWLAAHPLGRHVSERRRARMVRVLDQRLTSLTVVAENLHDAHNVSAVVRTAEGFGLDRVHIVEMPNPYQRNAAIVRGADRWLSIVRYDRLTRCLLGLEGAGFRLAVADVGPGCVPLDELSVSTPLAIVLGSEHDGLSTRARGLAETRFTIPMPGFTESFNVSVSAAIALFDLSRRRRTLLGGRGELTLDEKKERLEEWLKKTVRHAQKILQREAASSARGRDG